MLTEEQIQKLKEKAQSMDREQLTSLVNGLNLQQVTDQQLAQFIAGLDQETILKKMDEMK